MNFECNCYDCIIVNGDYSNIGRLTDTNYIKFNEISEEELQAIATAAFNNGYQVIVKTSDPEEG